MSDDGSMRRWKRVIIGIDPGTNVMGYGVVGVAGRAPEVVAPLSASAPHP